MLARCAAALLLIAVPAVGSAQERGAAESQAQARLEQRAGEAVAVLQGSAPAEAVFTPAFLTAVSEAQLRAMTAQMEAQHGRLQGVESVQPVGPDMARLRLRFQRAIATGGLQLETTAPHRIQALRLTEFAPMDVSAEEIVAELRALPGAAGALLVTLDAGASRNAPLVSHEPERQLAIGSAFKLYVLSALARSIAAGEHRWDEVVPLAERSLPSGQLQDWPPGAPLTLQTLATLMISGSDNTATDQLIAVLGREAVEAELAATGHAEPQRNRPFLTTRELFVLKGGEAGTQARYAAAGVGARRAILSGLAGQAPNLAAVEAALAKGPTALDIEWFASAQDVVRLFERLRALPEDTALRILAVRPQMGATARANWAYAGFKGGSEPGVLHFSWLLQDRAGAWYVLTLGWNNGQAPLDQTRLELIAQRALALAAEQSE